jgi:hypothetical protein
MDASKEGVVSVDVAVQDFAITFAMARTFRASHRRHLDEASTLQRSHVPSPRGMSLTKPSLGGSARPVVLPPQATHQKQGPADSRCHTGGATTAPLPPEEATHRRGCP